MGFKRIYMLIKSNQPAPRVLRSPGLRARDFSTERVLSRTLLLIISVPSAERGHVVSVWFLRSAGSVGKISSFLFLVFVVVTLVLCWWLAVGCGVWRSEGR